MKRFWNVVRLSIGGLPVLQILARIVFHSISNIPNNSDNSDKYADLWLNHIRYNCCFWCFCGTMEKYMAMRTNKLELDFFCRFLSNFCKNPSTEESMHYVFQTFFSHSMYSHSSLRNKTATTKMVLREYMIKLPRVEPPSVSCSLI